MFHNIEKAKLTVNMKLLLTFLLTILAQCLFCQDTIRTYFNALWRPTVSKDTSYYRKVYKNAQNSWVVNDFYADGQLQMQGYYSNPKAKKKTGHFTYYYANGAKESEGEYVDGYKTGRWVSWFPSNSLDSEGSYSRNKKIGPWVWYHKNGQISARERYDKDKMKEFEYFDEAGVKSNVSTAEANLVSEFPGGIEGFLSWMKTSMVYPEEARIKGISGIVYVNFIVEKDGSISNIKIENPTHALLDAEALRVIKSMPKWRAGKDHNRSLEIVKTAPIRFTLE